RIKLSEFPIAKNAVTYTTYDETRKGQFRTKRGTLWAPFANLVLVKVWQDTCMRQAITPEQRPVATLRYLATGRSLQDLKFLTGISSQALGIIIPETCSAIIQVLQKEYMK
ncbi:hypothetical protein AB205_0058080, partial [Aquarana catesbeiana]